MSVDGVIVTPHTVITARMAGEKDCGIIQVVDQSTTQESSVPVYKAGQCKT